MTVEMAGTRLIRLLHHCVKWQYLKITYIRVSTR